MPAVATLKAKLNSLSGSEDDSTYRVDDYRPMGLQGRYDSVL